MKYRFRLVAHVTVEAENIVEAKKRVKMVRVIGERHGRGRPSIHDRDSITYAIDIDSSKIERLAEAVNVPAQVLEG